MHSIVGGSDLSQGRKDGGAPVWVAVSLLAVASTAHAFASILPLTQPGGLV